MPKIVITSGDLRGRQISTPDTGLIHPMGSRERLALFNTLVSLNGPLGSETKILDCFCGSGALGLEAISRGAGSVTFVDQNSQAITTTKQNIANLGLENHTKVVKSSYQNLADAKLGLGPFDIILADPPYDNFPANLTALSHLLTKQGIIVLSHPDTVDPAVLLPDFDLIRTKKHAAANLSFLVKHDH